MGDNNDASCSGCDFISPCIDQGLCLDPTVLHLPPSSPESGAVAGAGGGGQSSQHRQGFLIEGQLVVASSDGMWQPTALPTATTPSITSVTSTLPAAGADAAVDPTTPATTTAPATTNTSAAAAAAAVFTAGTPHMLTGAEIVSLGLPASPEEARAYLVRTHADTVPHGDHVDFVVGDRLIHIVTAGDNVNGDCGSDCGNHHEGGAGGAGGEAGAGGGARGGGGGGGTVLGHAWTPAVVDHGRVHIARRRLGAAADAPPAASIASSSTAAAAGGNGNGNGNGKPPSSVPRAAIGGGRYMPLVKKQDASSAAAADGDVTADVTSVEAVHLALTVEHAGGGEVGGWCKLNSFDPWI